MAFIVTAAVIGGGAVIGGAIWAGSQVIDLFWSGRKRPGSRD
jgi:hypothetical protein